jgi:hypothetical protein
MDDSDTGISLGLGMVMLFLACAWLRNKEALHAAHG